MRELSCDVLVIGGGPAGLAAAYQARQEGAERIVILERNQELGGILPQCIHNGFGVREFGTDLTGPEYAYRWIHRVQEAGIQVLTHTMVLSLTPQLEVLATNTQFGMLSIKARAIVLAMGCRERPRGALAIPGSRPAGIYTAGTAQRLVNIEGYMPGRRFVILGSGDIGMIMARRLTLEGAEVVTMAEILPYVSGLRRNLVQCVRDFDIPLRLGTTVTEVLGDERVEGVVLSAVDAQWRPISGSSETIPCDTLLLSVGLIPENELSLMAGVRLDPVTGGPFIDEQFATTVPGIYAAGNAVHVHDLVDDVSESALRAGKFAALYAMKKRPLFHEKVRLVPGENVRHIVPQTIHPRALELGPSEVYFRVRQPIEAPVYAEVWAGQQRLINKRLRYVRPSEMVILQLDSRHISALLQTEQAQVRIASRS